MSGPTPEHELDDSEVVLFLEGDVLEEELLVLEGPLHGKSVLVRGGPPCWDGKPGRVDLDSGGETVVVLIASSDDAGQADFRVRMPRSLVVLAGSVAKAKA